MYRIKMLCAFDVVLLTTCFCHLTVHGGHLMPVGKWVETVEGTDSATKAF